MRFKKRLETSGREGAAAREKNLDRGGWSSCALGDKAVCRPASHLTNSPLMHTTHCVKRQLTAESPYKKLLAVGKSRNVSGETPKKRSRGRRPKNHYSGRSRAGRTRQKAWQLAPSHRGKGRSKEKKSDLNDRANYAEAHQGF